MVYEVENLEDFKKQLKEAGDKLVVVDFTATWCGPCKMIGPYFVELASKYPNVVFLKVDVDEAEDVNAFCDIKCMPTFVFFKNEKRVDDFAGANREKLLEMLLKHL